MLNLPIAILTILSCIAKVGGNGFATISNTGPDYTCLLYAGEAKDETILTAIFREPVDGQGLQVHAKIYDDIEEAHASSTNDLIKKYCPMQHEGDLSDSLVRAFFNSSEYNQYLCSKYEKDSKQFFNHLSTHHPSVVALSTENRLYQLFPNECEPIIEILNGTRIVMDRETYALIGKYVHLFKSKYFEVTNEDSLIKRLIVKFKWSPWQSINDTIAVPPAYFEEWYDNTDPNYLNSAEFILATLMQISSPARFINDCRLDNTGKRETSSMNPIIEEGFVYSLVPPFSYNKLFYQYVLIESDTREPDSDDLISTYFNFLTDNGRLWKTFDDIKKLPVLEFDQRYIYTSDKKRIFDLQMYRRRVELVVRPFLLDSNQRAKDVNKLAVVIVPRIESLFDNMDYRFNREIVEEYILNFIIVLENLHKEELVSNISDLLFNHFTHLKNFTFRNLMEYAEEVVGQPLKHEHHRTFINPTDKDAMEEVVGEWKGKVLIYGIPWEGNSYPGIEYLTESEKATIARSAAACSTLGESQNPQINTEYLMRFKVY